MGRSTQTGLARNGPPRVEAALADLAARQHGVVALAQLETLGLTSAAWRHRATMGSLHRIHLGVYAVGHARLAADGRWMVAVLACGARAVLSHRSAAAAWGLRATARRRVDVATPERGRRGPETVELHRVRRLDPRDVTRQRSIPITTIARTLVDLADVLALGALSDCIHEAEVLRLLDVAAVEAAIQRAPGRRGAGRLQAALGEPCPGPTRSELERRFKALCRDAGLPAPALNTHVALPDRLIEVDGVWPGARVIVELDSEGVHATRRAFHRDRRRDTALAAEGYVVARLTWQRVVYEPDDVAEELMRILAQRPHAGPAVRWQGS